MDNTKINRCRSSQKGTFDSNKDSASNESRRKGKPEGVRTMIPATQLQNFSRTTMNLLNANNIMRNQQQIESMKFVASSGGVVVR